MGRELQRSYGQPSQIVLTTPILEGTDGVQKMSKSYGNYIGINEPPQEIYGKVMSISDDLMWRYYELLTDVSTRAIEQMKADVAAGRQHPMELKKALARRIVQDFHSAEAARAADENWSKQFQKDEVPENVEEARVSFQSVYVSNKEEDALNGKHTDIDVRENWEKLDRAKFFPAVIRLDKVLLHAGFVDSSSEAARKRSERAVKVNGITVVTPQISKFVPGEMLVRVGRQFKKVTITLP